eukprot:1092900-Rhodomonas_salina.1
MEAVSADLFALVPPLSLLRLACGRCPHGTGAVEKVLEPLSQTWPAPRAYSLSLSAPCSLAGSVDSVEHRRARELQREEGMGAGES